MGNTSINREFLLQDLSLKNYYKHYYINWSVDQISIGYAQV